MYMILFRGKDSVLHYNKYLLIDAGLVNFVKNVTSVKGSFMSVNSLVQQKHFCAIHLDIKEGQNKNDPILY